ncbi:MAG: metal ABC transporter permease [Deltaproteobacteria bacterium]|nr:metal ABC transporter permease [Deltaproteobacteria bacterium]
MFEFVKYDFMIRAIIAGIVIAIIGPMIGIFLVVRRYSLLADTLAHVSLAGVAIGLLTKINPIITATVVSVLSVLGIEKLKSGNKELGESLLALFLWGGLALAIIIISIADGFNASLYSYLFGSITSVTRQDLVMIIILGVVTLFVIGGFFKEFFLISFDEEQAKINGIKVKTLNLILLILTAVCVSFAIRIVGVILVGALMVIPVISAMKFNRNFVQTLWISIGLSLVSVLLGISASYYFDFASGGSIVLTAILIFLFSLGLNRFFIKS